MKPRAKEKNPKKLRNIDFRLDKEQRKLVDHLCDFFQMKTRVGLFGHMLIMAVMQIAATPVEEHWTKQQRKAHKFCCKAVQEVVTGFVHAAAKEVVAETKPSLETLKQLSKAELVLLAETKHLSIVELRKSGIIKKVLAND